MLNYYTSDGKLDAIWVDSKAREAAEQFASTDRSSIALKNSQLRRFYADVKSLERQWQAANDKDAAFDSILPMIKLLKAKSEYALMRKVVPQSFRDWLWEHVDAVKTSNDFRAFLLHFEAVVGFSARYTKD